MSITDWLSKGSHPCFRRIPKPDFKLAQCSAASLVSGTWQKLNNHCNRKKPSNSNNDHQLILMQMPTDCCQCRIFCNPRCWDTFLSCVLGSRTCPVASCQTTWTSFVALILVGIRGCKAVSASEQVQIVDCQLSSKPRCRPALPSFLNVLQATENWLEVLSSAWWFADSSSLYQNLEMAATQQAFLLHSVTPGTKNWFI